VAVSSQSDHKGPIGEAGGHLARDQYRFDPNPFGVILVIGDVLLLVIVRYHAVGLRWNGSMREIGIGPLLDQ
jgi:hypothetical protein